MKSEDFIPKDLANQIAKAVAEGFKKGSEKAFSGQSFLDDLNESMKEYSKEQKTQQFNNLVQQRALDKQISTKEAEVDILAKLAKEQNNAVIRELQQNAAITERLMLNAELMGNMKAFYGFQEKLSKMQGDITGLQEENATITKQVDLYKKILKQKQEEEKLDQKKEAVKEKIHEVTDALKKQIGITQDLIDLLKTPELAKAVFAEQMAEKLGEVYESFEKLNQSGLSLGQRIDYMTKGFSLMSLAGLSDTKGVLDGMNETFGSLNGLTSSEVDHLGHLAKSMGVTGQEALALAENFSKLPGETMETATHTADFVKDLAKANNVAPGKITKEIAKNTELIAVGGYRGAKAFAEAAMKAQKMGVELSTTAKVMNSLLNFEDSINKQMEASVLLGREINLDKARELALNGKSVEATQEILRNVGGQAAFEKMNVLQKQALAAAAGMTVEELQKGLDAQIETNKYSGEQTSDLKERLGFITEVGGGIVGFFKEYGLAILAATQLMSTLKLQKLGVLALDKVSSLFSKTELSFAEKRVLVAQRLAAAKKAEAGGSFLGAGAAAAVGPMLAFGAAVLMVGAGLGIAALGMSKLVESFSGLGDAAGPAAVAVLGLSAAFAIMVPSLVALATTSAATIGPMLALGAAVMLIGGGVAIASLGLAKMAESSKGLTDIGDALVNMGTGLSSIALNGYKALPIFAALTGLASVAPALSTLGEAFGGPKVGKEEEASKMDDLISEVRALKEVINKGGAVYMDSRKVGEALRLYGYTTKV